jgi:hypothetical protein
LADSVLVHRYWTKLVRLARDAGFFDLFFSEKEKNLIALVVGLG